MRAAAAADSGSPGALCSRQSLLRISHIYKLFVVSKHVLSEMHFFCLNSTLLPKSCLVTR